ncbi:MAG: DinB family protein [Alphaproteobacteria bacterium]
MKALFTMLADYNAWANARLFAAAAALPDRDYRADRGAFFGSLHGTLNHLLVGDLIWLHRLTGEGTEPATLDGILHDDLGSLSAARRHEDARFVRYIASLDEATLADGTVTYRSTRNPMEIEQKLAPLLLHVFNHQTHHRGQAHGILTMVAGEAPSLDLLMYQRSTGESILKGGAIDVTRPERRPAR